MKKILNILSWIGIAVFLIVTLSFVTSKKSMVICEKIKIEIKDTTNNYFVEKRHILSLIEQQEKGVRGYPIDKINLADLEELITNEPSVKHAEVYKTIDGTLNVEIEQRTPIVRIIDYNGTSYYIDIEGVVMPLSNKYTSRVLIANGNIKDYFELKSNIKLNTKKDKRKYRQLFDLYTLSKYIYLNSFWSAQIEQIYVNENNELELVPKVGPHIIVLGQIDKYQDKFRRLKILYEEGLKNEGWNQYKYINLKYENQIVCTRR